MSNVASSVYESPMHQERIEGIIVTARDTIASRENENKRLPFVALRVVLLLILVGVLLTTLSAWLAVFYAGFATYHVFTVISKIKSAYTDNQDEIRRAKGTLCDCRKISRSELHDLKALAEQKDHSMIYLKRILSEREFVLRGEARVIEAYVALTY